jgi:2-polyprenyl-6-methoxyphenol hydroxylase-like FAD-dependent oxidoreductase
MRSMKVDQSEHQNTVWRARAELRVQDAENLAWNLAALGWVAGQDAERLLGAYSQERRPAALENL